MAKYRFYYILFAVVSTVLMFSYKSKLTSVLFLIAIAIPVISFVLLVFSRLLVKIRIEYRSLTAEKFENTDISVTVTNRFIIPLSPAEAKVKRVSVGLVISEIMKAVRPPFKSNE